ncbi:hypothetical protein AXX16_1665 [Serratia rubidaea]|nr:hypothetical protein AXX16_1665 [Serratia rubidaea]
MSPDSPQRRGLIRPFSRRMRFIRQIIVVDHNSRRPDGVT